MNVNTLTPSVPQAAHLGHCFSAGLPDVLTINGLPLADCIEISHATDLDCFVDAMESLLATKPAIEVAHHWDKDIDPVASLYDALSSFYEHYR